jgi:hypothetical protein
MDQNRTRTMRCHHLARIKKNRANYYGGHVGNFPAVKQARHLGRLGHTAPSCNYWMCGNRSIICGAGDGQQPADQIWSSAPRHAKRHSHGGTANKILTDPLDVRR